MLDDFTPIIHRLEGRTIKVWAVADVHIGYPNANVAGFERFLKRIHDDEDSYMVICGDILDNGTRDSCADYTPMTPAQQIDKAVELLEPVKDKILGCVSGNHEFRSRKKVDIDPLYTAFCILRKQEVFRQNFAFIRVSLMRGTTHDHYALMLIHGKTANKQKQFPYAVEGVDAIISGHVHSGNISKQAHLVFGQNNVCKVKPIVNLVATSWVEYGGYAARSLYMPNATSDPQALRLEFTNSNNKQGNISVIW